MSNGNMDGSTSSKKSQTYRIPRPMVYSSVEVVSIPWTPLRCALTVFEPYERVVASRGSWRRIHPSASPETKYVWDAVKCKWVRIDGTWDRRTAVPAWVLRRISSEAAVETATVDAFDALFENVVIWLPGL